MSDGIEIPRDDMEENRDAWRAMCLRLARHLLNPGQIPLHRWGAKAVDLLVEVREMDPLAYDHSVKPKD